MDRTAKHVEKQFNCQEAATLLVPRSKAMMEKRMQEKESIRSFSEVVAQQLAPDTRELWAPMADYFDREGPEAAKTYLDAERERLENNVRSLLEQFKER